MNKKLAFIICLVMLTVQLRTTPVLYASNDSPAEDYAVYSALINQKYVTDRIKLIVIKIRPSVTP